MPEATQDPLKVFIIYAREDRDALLELKKQLIPLERRRQIAVWYDGEIVPGAEWEKAIKTQLETAHIILLLLSSDFFASDYIEKKELRDALARHERGEAVVTPVIVRHCLWQAHPEIEKLQVLPDNAHPVYSKRHWDSPDEAFANVAAGIARLVKNLLDAETAAEPQRIESEAKRRREQEEAARKKREEEEAARRKWEEEEVARKNREAEEAARIKRQEKAARSKFMPNMVLVKGGTFQMGNVMGDEEVFDENVHPVTLSDFYISRYAVTFDEYDAFCADTGREKPGDEDWGRGRRPVMYVSWHDAVAYCNWLSKKTGLIPVYTIRGEDVAADWSADGFRLPTEAEWEYAAREGGRKVRFGNGKDIADPKEINFNGSKDYKKPYSIAGEYRRNTVPVGSLHSPNALGLHDMIGNIFEWCWDWYDDYPGTLLTNPTGPSSGSYRVGRGGSWSRYPQYVRVAFRFSYTSGDRSFSLGFRLARSVQ